MSLPPLRWKVAEEALLTPEDVLHRPDCRTHPHGVPLAAGAVLERSRAVTRCNRCYPMFELLLGPASRGANFSADVLDETAG